MQKKARPRSVFLCVFLWNCPERRRKPGSNDNDGTSNHVIASPRRGRGNPYPVQALLPRSVVTGTRAGGKGSALRKMTAYTRYGLPRRSAPRNDRGSRSPGADYRPHLSLRGPEGAAAISGKYHSAEISRPLVPRDCHVAPLLAMTEEIEVQAHTIDHICHCEAPKGEWQSLGSIIQPQFSVRRCPEIATGLTALAMTCAIRCCTKKSNHPRRGYHNSSFFIFHSSSSSCTAPPRRSSAW